jgi:tetratricopeptide (TPR) repeat protein
MKKLIFIVFLPITYYLLPITYLNAQDFQEAEVLYLKGEYKQTIDLLEKILASHMDRSSPPKLYYLLGLSYTKYGNLLRADDCFDIIVKEYPNSELVQPALIKLIDVDILKVDYSQALNRCESFLNKYSKSNLASEILWRQYIINLKLANVEKAQSFLTELKNAYPDCPQLKASLEVQSAREKEAALDYFSVQVGSFKDKQNAQNLVDSLKKKGFDSYIRETTDQSGVFFRVRVGQLSSRQEVQNLDIRLKQEGFPTKIYP